MRFRDLLRRALRANSLYLHDYGKDARPDRAGVGPFRHRHGNMTISWTPEEETVHDPRTALRVEWSIFPRSHHWFGVTLQTEAGEKELHVGFGFGALYATLERSPHYRHLREREYSIQFTLPGRHGSFAGRWGTLRWRFGCDPMGWSYETPKWRDGSFDLYDALMDRLVGRATYTSVVLETHDVLVPMPEGTYPAQVSIGQATRRRARWPWPTSVTRSASITIPGGIPVPGKGENSWDCGDDAIQATGSWEPSIAAAIASAVRAATEARLKYGGPNWKPPAQREAASA